MKVNVHQAMEIRFKKLAIWPTFCLYLHNTSCFSLDGDRTNTSIIAPLNLLEPSILFSVNQLVIDH